MEIIVKNLIRTVFHRNKTKFLHILIVCLAIISIGIIRPRSKFCFSTTSIDNGIELHVINHTALRTSAYTNHILESMSCQIVHIVVIALVTEQIQSVPSCTYADVDNIDIFPLPLNGVRILCHRRQHGRELFRIINGYSTNTTTGFKFQE